MGTIFHLDIVSTEESIYSGPAEFIVAPAVMGEVGIYPQHTPMLTRIKSGVVRVKAPLQDDEEIYVSGGMLEVQPDVVTILADTAVRGKDLDEAKALEAKQKAEEIMKKKNLLNTQKALVNKDRQENRNMKKMKKGKKIRRKKE